MNAPRVLVMGVSGAGKSTVGRLIAQRLGVPFIEGDEFHPPANRAKLEAGIPLTDADRAPWLEAIHSELTAQPGGWVLACSALKEAYRETLLRGLGDVSVVLLDGPPELLAKRLRERRGHFVDESILASQLATLERPEGAIVVDISQAPEAVVEGIVEGRRGT